MKKQIILLVVLLVFTFITGGFIALFQGLDVLGQVLVGFLPIFKPIIEQSFKDYFKSAYFIVGLIIFIGSTIGVALSIKERKTLYFIVSIILDLIFLTSIISNLAVCS